MVQFDMIIQEKIIPDLQTTEGWKEEGICTFLTFLLAYIGDVTNPTSAEATDFFKTHIDNSKGQWTCGVCGAVNYGGSTCFSCGAR